MKHKRLIVILALNLSLLLIPFTAMQFTDEVNWNTGDFVLAAVLLLISGLTMELTLRRAKKTFYRILILTVLVLLLVLIWAEIAVGYIESLISGL